MSFVSNPFNEVDVTDIAEQLSATFSLDAGQMERVTLQNDLHLKAHMANSNFWCLVDKENMFLLTE